jgi:ASCH domain-containing protein
MKCLSLKQPYAELLVSCKKAIEVRTWNTNFRGQFLVHASKKINEEACKRLKLDKAKLVTGAIVGKANLYGVYLTGTKILLSRTKINILQVQVTKNQNMVFWSTTRKGLIFLYLLVGN